MANSRARWGTVPPGAIRFSDDAEREWFLRLVRGTSPPGALVAEIARWIQTDVRDILPAIHVPVLILSREEGTGYEDPRSARLIAERLPSCRMVTYRANESWFELDEHRVADEVDAFFEQLGAFDPLFDRVLATVLFTDIVGSTELARELGDQRWSRLLAAQRRIVRAELKAHRGREIDTAGDGFFAVFDGPADAVRCAFASARKVQELGIDIRAGVHFGEVEQAGGQMHGIVVHTGARVMGQAGAAEVLVTGTVKDLVAGARFVLQERGVFELKGVPGSWTLFDVVAVDDELRPEPVEDATVATERRERISAAAPPRRRRWWLVPAVLIPVVAVLVVAAVSSRDRAYVPGAGTVARIDGGRFDQPVDVGSFPLALTEGDGRVWVMDRQSQVYWVVEDDRSTGSRGTDGVPTSAVTGAGAVWITAGFGTGSGANGAVSRLDPASGQIAQAFQTPIGSRAITYGGDAVWVADTNAARVTRFDPVSRETRPIPLPGSNPAPRPEAIAFGTVAGPAVWVGDALSPNVYRIDATGSDAIRTYTVGGPPTAIAVGPDAIWVASEQNDAVYAIDPASGSVRTSIDVGADGCNGPAAISVNDEGVWLACATSHLIVRIDQSGTVADTLSVGATPIGLTTAEDGSVWAAVQPS